MVKLEQQKLSKYYAEVTPMTGMLAISTDILDPIQKLQSFGKWYKEININRKDETSHDTQHQDAFLKVVQNENCVKHLRMFIIKPDMVPGNNLFPSAKASGFGQSSFDPYEVSSDDKQYFTPQSMAEMTPWRSNCITYLWTAATLYLNLSPEEPKNWG